MRATFCLPLLLVLLSGLICFTEGLGEEDNGGTNEENYRSEPASVLHEINNHLIYTLSKPVKKKKRDDRNSIDPGSIPLIQIATSILDASGLKGVIMNERIFACLGMQINKVLKTASKAVSSGGNTFKRLTDRWKSGRKENYKFKVYLHEIDNLTLMEENKNLVRQKRHAEFQLQQERKRSEKLEVSRKTWKQKFENAIKKIRKMQQRKCSRGKEHNKSYSEYSEKQRRRIRKSIRDECETALGFLGLYDLIPTKVEFYNFEEGNHEVVSLMDDQEFIENSLVLEHSENTTLTDNQLDDISLMLYVKDKFHISDLAWRELSQLANDMPSLYSLKSRIDFLNKKWNILPTPGPATGVQMKLSDGLHDQLKRLHKTGVNLSDIIKIKVSGDGTRVGKRLQLLNVTYTIINEEKIAMSEKGNYVVAVIKTIDDYEGIRESLSDLIVEMRNMKDIKIDGKVYNLEYFLGGDWKFLATVCGIGPANQDFACIWCKCPRSERWNPDKEWSLTDPAKGARTVDEIKKFFSQRKFNCQRKPLFDFIPMDHVIIDTLHLFLRIADVLIELLIKELRTQDAVLKKEVFNGGFLREKHKSMANYEKFLNSIGISFHWEINKDTRKLCYRDLTGPEKLLVFQKINIPELLPNTDERHKIKNIWDHFIDIIGNLKLTYASDDDISKFQDDVKMWVKEFNEIYQTKDVTPYMHALHIHVPEFIGLYKNLSFFSQQGLEKYNDQCSKDYFRSSNHQGIEVLRQLLLKRNRIQLLEAEGAERVKASYKCRNCQQIGHTIKKCVNKCSEPNCIAAICCAHLVKVNGKWEKQCCF